MLPLLLFVRYLVLVLRSMYPFQKFLQIQQAIVGHHVADTARATDVLGVWHVVAVVRGRVTVFVADQALLPLAVINDFVSCDGRSPLAGRF